MEVQRFPSKYEIINYYSSFSLYMIIIIIKVPSFDDISHYGYTTNLIYNTDDFLKKKLFYQPKNFYQLNRQYNGQMRLSV